MSTQVCLQCIVAYQSECKMYIWLPLAPPCNACLTFVACLSVACSFYSSLRRAACNTTPPEGLYSVLSTTVQLLLFFWHSGLLNPFLFRICPAFCPVNGDVRTFMAWLLSLLFRWLRLTEQSRVCCTCAHACTYHQEHIICTWNPISMPGLLREGLEFVQETLCGIKKMARP